MVFSKRASSDPSYRDVAPDHFLTGIGASVCSPKAHPSILEGLTVKSLLQRPGPRPLSYDVASDCGLVWRAMGRPTTPAFVDSTPEAKGVKGQTRQVLRVRTSLQSRLRCGLTAPKLQRGARVEPSGLCSHSMARGLDRASTQLDLLFPTFRHEPDDSCGNGHLANYRHQSNCDTETQYSVQRPREEVGSPKPDSVSDRQH